MKELDELREWVTYKSTLSNHTEQYTLARLDAIEQAIADRYMELPLDADGVPIHVGDDLGVGMALYVSDDGVCIGGNSCGFWEATSLRHAKPVTVEDVLLDAGVSVAAVSDVAAEIRELLEMER